MCKARFLNSDNTHLLTKKVSCNVVAHSSKHIARPQLMCKTVDSIAKVNIKSA